MENVTRYETALTQEQMKTVLFERNDIFAVRWNHRQSRFVVRRKRPFRMVMSKSPINVRIKGEITSSGDNTFVELSSAPVMSIADTLIFIILTFLILFSTRTRTGLDTGAILIALAAITVFVFIVMNIFTKYTRSGIDLCLETVEILERALNLNRVA